MPGYQPTQQMHRNMVQEDAHRSELFEGRRTAELNGEGGPTDQLTIDELVAKAEHTHQDTTAAARRALKIVKETATVQENTLKELEAQGQQLNRANQMVNQVNQDLTYSEKLLLYMRTCCCCWMCDSCTGADPEMARTKQWQKSVEKGATARNDQSAQVYRDRQNRDPSTAPNGGQAGGNRASGAPGGSRPQYKDPDIRLTEEHKNKELQLSAETRKQNELLEEIHGGLDHLLNNAKVIGGELEEQNRAVGDLRDRLEDTHGRIKNVNTKSQLKEFKIKK